MYSIVLFCYQNLYCNRDYPPNTVHLTFKSVAWLALLVRGTGGTSQNINIMRRTQRGFNVGHKISRLSYEEEIILMMAAYECERFPVFANCIHVFILNRAPCTAIREGCVYGKQSAVKSTQCDLPHENIKMEVGEDRMCVAVANNGNGEKAPPPLPLFPPCFRHWQNSRY